MWMQGSIYSQPQHQEEVGWLVLCSAAFTPGEIPRYSFLRRLSGPQDQSAHKGVKKFRNKVLSLILAIHFYTWNVQLIERGCSLACKTSPPQLECLFWSCLGQLHYWVPNSSNHQILHFYGIQTMTLECNFQIGGSIQVSPANCSHFLQLHRNNLYQPVIPSVYYKFLASSVFR